MAEYLTTRELAELLRIKERKVYDLAASGELPCSRAMGKLLFPRAEVEAWLAAGRRDPQTAPARPASPLPNVFLGSHDPLLEWALRESQCGLATFFDGSADGLRRFKAHEGIATGLHLHDTATDAWNVPQVAAQFGNSAVVLVEWAVRERGLILGPAWKKKPRGLSDLAGCRFAARQNEAGAQLLFVELMKQAGLEEASVQTSATARSETDVALLVQDGKADAGFGLATLAHQYRLDFVPIIEERYDLLVDRRSWFEPPMQTFIRFCQEPNFTDRAAELGGYNVSGFGRIHFNGH